MLSFVQRLPLVHRRSATRSLPEPRATPRDKVHPTWPNRSPRRLGGVGAGEAGSSISPVDAGVKNRTAADRPAQSQSQPAPRRGESLPRSRADDLRPPEARSFESLVNAIRLRTSDRHSSARSVWSRRSWAEFAWTFGSPGSVCLWTFRLKLNPARIADGSCGATQDVDAPTRDRGRTVRCEAKSSDAGRCLCRSRPGGAADPLQPPTPRHEPGRNAGPVRKEPDIGRRGALTSGGGEHSVRSAVGDRRLDFMA